LSRVAAYDPHMGGRGLRVAVLAGALASLVVAAPAPAARWRAADDLNPLVWRGIVEGAYGRTWSHGERMQMLRWMARHRFNAYVHAPKDDLYQRTNWRDPYPTAQQRDFDEEIALANRLHIEWIPNLSPALPLIPTPALPSALPSVDLCFSCPRDLGVLVAKLKPFIDAGSHAVMISFDDVLKVMSHPEDLLRYGAGDEAFGRANGEFFAALERRLGAIDKRIAILTVGADYSGSSDTAYLRGLRGSLPADVEVMWTGTSIPSADWSPAAARAYGRAIARPPVVWENWTNNDTAGNALLGNTTRIFLGPYRRRPDDAAAVRGFFFNPANEAAVNMLPLATAGEWMDDPAHYSRTKAWARALADLAPGRTVAARRRRDALRAWAETSWSNKLDQAEAPTFVRRRDRFLAAYAEGAAWTGPWHGLIDELELVERGPLPAVLVNGGAPPFIASARANARAGLTAARLLAAERPRIYLSETATGYDGLVRRPDPAAASGLRDLLQRQALSARLSPRFTYGWRLGIAIELPPYPVPGNVMDAFLDRATALDRAWQAHADEAAARVTLTLDGAPIEVSPGGRFVLERSACGHELAATDGAGGRTTLRLAAC
jgi:hyaluronoglucosaminidase